MWKLLLAFLILPLVFNLYAQEDRFSDEAIYRHIDKSVSDAVTALTDKCDPYGFTLTVKISRTGTEGKAMVMYPIDKSRIEPIIEREVLSRLRFGTFDLKEPIRVAPGRQGIFFMMIGLTPSTAPEIGYEVFSNDLSVKVSSTENGYQELDVQVAAVFLTSMPNDGAVLGEVYYADPQGENVKWNSTAFPSSPAGQKAKVRYRRLGPGDDRTNSGAEEPSTDWKPVGNTSQSDFQIDTRTPGHYFPTVKLRGCTQRFEDLQKDAEKEAVVKTKGTMSWENKLSMNATREANKDVFTTYSLANTVKGRVLDANNRPVKGKKTIVLEPKGWEVPDTAPAEVISMDENFEFPEMVSSGVYSLYVKGQTKKETVEVCNCREKSEGPDYTYIQDIGGSPDLYVTLETTYTKTEDLDAQTAGSFGSSGTGQVQQVSKTKVVFHISEAEIIDNGGGITIMHSIGSYPAESYNTTTGKLQVPWLTTEGWKDENNSWTEKAVPQASQPHIYELNPKDNERYQMTDMLGIIPLFSDPYKESKIDMSEIEDEGAKSMLKSLESLSNALDPLADDADKYMEEGEYLEKVKSKTFTFQELINAAYGKSTISLNDKTVQRIDTQVNGMFDMGSENANGFNELSKYYAPGSDIQKDMKGAGQTVNGGLSNFVMTNSYNRPVTTTVTRNMGIRQATEAEVRDSKALLSEQMLNELPMMFIKEVRIIY